jgi:hypothetical protein
MNDSVAAGIVVFAFAVSSLLLPIDRWPHWRA